MILHALIFGVVAALLGFFMKIVVGDLRSAYATVWWGFPFGILLAAYLWIVLGVRSFAKCLVVVFMAQAAFCLYLGQIFTLVIVWVFDLHSSSQRVIVDSFFTGTVGGGLVSVGFLAALPWPREDTRYYSQVLLCAAAGGLLSVAGAILEDLTFIFIPLGGVWHGGMAVMLALMANLRLARSSEDTAVAENA
jgi:hypothetical protein